ncbi:MAG TPA: YqaA family protein [Paludibacteraceae bacterium]|nr:DedA family protein [Paludibacteraceae bacterium]OPZ02902.1 MAG: Inner membrane protein YqaA [Bacteroidetes bacterium ADurb.BinA395]MBP8966112.1 DedA family protein [Paludibacteraceae bacterium]HOF99258.1 YqaA family protein [Paludibacteraceae bacterium]HOJ66825.1 YqaA family protein [Paludibacteraceae bacterium]
MLEFTELGYLGLFIGSFLAATVVPFSSEVIFSTMVFGGLNAWTCVFVATAGNWLGGMTSFYLGKLGKIEWIEKYFHVKKEKIDQFLEKFHKYGEWFVFFSFLPFIGDAIAIAAGFLRARWWATAAFMLAGKFCRYVVWMYVNGLILMI